MNKKGIILIVLLFLITIFTSCTYGSYSIKVGDVEMGNHEISGSYSSFNGFKQRTYDFEEGDSFNFNTIIETESGELKVLLIDEDDNVIHEISNTGNSSFEIKETGEYSIRVEGVEHKGSFSVEIERK